MSAVEKAGWVIGFFVTWVICTLAMVALTQSWGGSLLLTFAVMLLVGGASAEMLGKAIGDK